MIINSNALNIDTNTQRTNAEINALIDAKLSNVTKKVLLSTINLNRTISTHGTSLGTFNITKDMLLSYTMMRFEFTGSIQTTLTGEGTSRYFSIVIYPKDQSSITLINVTVPTGVTSITTISFNYDLRMGSYYSDRTGSSRSVLLGYNNSINIVEGLAEIELHCTNTSNYLNGTLRVYGVG